jgi:hypothetical protein
VIELKSGDGGNRTHGKFLPTATAPEHQAGRTRSGCKCGSPCFYCGSDLAGRYHEHDHFPLPWRHGGRTTVPACGDCHDMKDRISFLDWSDLKFTAAVDDMPRTAVISLMLLRSGVLVGDDGPELLTDQARKCEGVEARIAFAKFIGLALDEAGVAA